LVSDIAAGELVELKRGAGKASHLRGDARAFDGGRPARLFDAAAMDSPVVVSSSRPSSSVDDEGALGVELDQSAGHEQHAAGREHADDLVARSGRVGERAAEVEDGAEAEGAAQGADGPSSPGGRGRVEEHEAGFAQAFAASSGESSMGTPRASSTSAAPQREVTARLPCLATLAPAAAAENSRVSGKRHPGGSTAFARAHSI
jgi:hypothetical protein